MRILSTLFLLSFFALQSLASFCSELHLASPQIMKSRLESFVSQFPGHSAYLPSTSIEFQPPRGQKIWSGTRDLLLISTAKMSHDQLTSISDALLQTVPRHSISFPLKEGVSHLLTRMNKEVFDFDTHYLPSPNESSKNLSPIFSKRAYRPPSSSSRRIEPFIRLSEAEFAALQYFVQKALSSPKATLGDFNMQGKLNNTISSSSGHNCTSWLCSFQISPSQAVIDILGISSRSPLPLNVATNPGYLAAHLATLAPSDRVPFVVIWTPEPLEIATQKIQKSKLTDWNFNPID
jgi:hypothetical protein